MVPCWKGKRAKLLARRRILLFCFGLFLLCCARCMLMIRDFSERCTLHCTAPHYCGEMINDFCLLSNFPSCRGLAWLVVGWMGLRVLLALNVVIYIYFMLKFISYWIHWRPFLFLTRFYNFIVSFLIIHFTTKYCCWERWFITSLLHKNVRIIRAKFIVSTSADRYPLIIITCFVLPSALGT